MMPRGRPRNTAAAAPTAPRGRANNRLQVSFAYKLVLNQWLLSLFNVNRFEDLAENLRNEALEGLDENNVHHFHHALTAQLFNLTQLPTELLLEYDQNIVRHTQRLNERRITRGEQPIVWKYFQYLTLIFTEIYLDRYFRDPKALLAALNAQVATYNADKPEADQIAHFDEVAEAWPQLNKLAYWSATGSGKTLLMHANILQYQHTLEKHGRRRELNRILLLTPNEGLSQQHLREFEAAGIAAELFNKDGRELFTGRAVEILEVTRLRDEMGEKTIAIDAFEGNNLVVVDEGHRGASSGEEGAWMRFRNALCEKGFSFEYSATFGQAVKGKPKAGNFHPDFILWLLADGKQHVIFVDPKGIRNLGATDPKIQFYETIKEIEQRLGDASVHLQSFIVSNTPSHTMRMLWNMEKSEMQRRHVIFQEEDRDSYVRSMLDVAGAGGAAQ
jgi:hypothetical protein